MSSSAIVKMPKRLDYSSSKDFDVAFGAALAPGVHTISLDCTAVEVIDSSGMGLLILAYKKAKQEQVNVVAVNIPTAIREVLLVANLQKIIELN